MDLNTAAVIFMGGYVVVIVVAGLIMSLRPGGGMVPLVATTPAGSGTACDQAIPLGGEAEVLGNFRGKVQSVLVGPRSGKLEEILLASGGGIIEGGRVPARAIVDADGHRVQIAEPWTERVSDGSPAAVTLQRDAVVLSESGKRLGKLRMVCFDRDTGYVGGLVAAGRGRTEQLVFLPINRVKAAGATQIRTDLRTEDWASLQMYASDEAIKRAVLDRLEQDETTRPFVRSLAVEVDHQRVGLRGYVRTQAQAEQAAAVARSVPGVLAVERGIRSDEDLVRAVREAIDRDLGTSATNLDVRSEFGQIDIVGQVRDRQALRRIDAAARQVPGVLVMHNLATVG